MSEQDIVKGCIKGDRNAQKQLYEKYGGYLFGICYRYLGNWKDAEDLLHDSFITIFTHFSQFKWKGEDSLKAWTVQVVKNTILMYLREQKYWIETDDLIEAMNIEDSGEGETSDIPYDVLISMIAELPTRFRVIFNMYIIDGLSHKEISKALGIKEKSSSSQLAKAKAMMIKKINIWREKNK